MPLPLHNRTTGGIKVVCATVPGIPFTPTSDGEYKIKKQNKDEN